MALARAGNLIYIDTTTGATFAEDKVLLGVVIYASHATTTAAVIIENASSITAKTQLPLYVTPTLEKTKHFDFSFAPLFFPDGIKVSTLTNAVITLITAKNLEFKGS